MLGLFDGIAVVALVLSLFVSATLAGCAKMWTLIRGAPSFWQLDVCFWCPRLARYHSQCLTGEVDTSELRLGIFVGIVKGHFRINGPAFIYTDQTSGRVLTILGYPTDQIAQTALI